MKKIVPRSVMVCCFLLACAVCVSQAAMSEIEPGKALFCKGLGENGEPIEPGVEFDTNVVSCVFRGKKAFGVMQAVLSIYPLDGNGQNILPREQHDINPAWNVVYLPDIPLPAKGKYSFVLSSASGEVFSSGEVTIRNKTVDKPIPKITKVDGTTLEGLFHKYKNMGIFNKYKEMEKK